MAAIGVPPAGSVLDEAAGEVLAVQEGAGLWI
jgi:hypothetical protein